MCLVLTDDLQLLPPVTTIRSNTNICNHSPDGSSMVGLCKYTNEVTYAILVDIILVHWMPYRCSYLASFSLKESGQQWLTLLTLPVSRPPCFPQTSVSLWYLTIDVSLKSLSCSLGRWASLLVYNTIIYQATMFATYAATILTNYLLTHFGIQTDGFCNINQLLLSRAFSILSLIVLCAASRLYYYKCCVSLKWYTVHYTALQQTVASAFFYLIFEIYCDAVRL